MRDPGSSWLLTWALSWRSRGCSGRDVIKPGALSPHGSCWLSERKASTGTWTLGGPDHCFSAHTHTSLLPQRLSEGLTTEDTQLPQRGLVGNKSLENNRSGCFWLFFP